MKSCFSIHTIERVEGGKLAYDISVSNRMNTTTTIARSVSERKMLTITYNLRRILESLIENDDNKTETNEQKD